MFAHPTNYNGGSRWPQCTLSSSFQSSVQLSSSASLACAAGQDREAYPGNCFVIQWEGNLLTSLWLPSLAFCNVIQSHSFLRRGHSARSFVHRLQTCRRRDLDMIDCINDFPTSMDKEFTLYSPYNPAYRHYASPCAAGV